MTSLNAMGLMHFQPSRNALAEWDRTGAKG